MKYPPFVERFLVRLGFVRAVTGDPAKAKRSAAAKKGWETRKAKAKKSVPDAENPTVKFSYGDPANPDAGKCGGCECDEKPF